MATTVRWLRTAALLSALISAQSAAARTLDAIDSGWWNEFGSHTASNQNYMTGHSSSPEDVTRRSFFIFDLSTISAADTVLLATLLIDNSPGGYNSPNSSETFRLYDVSTPIEVLSAGGANAGVFNDLGSGLSYGARAVSSADNGRTIAITLNPAGVAAIDAALGDAIAIGGAITTLSGADVDEYVFGFFTQHDRRLVLTLASECGDGKIDSGEQCDDGNDDENDCCSSTCQYEAAGTQCDDGHPCTYAECDGAATCVGGPQPACLSAPQSTFQLKAIGSGRDRLKWSIAKGDAFDQIALGDPTAGAGYYLCVYDWTADQPELKAELAIDSSASWRNRDPKGLTYRDTDALQDGVTKVRIRTGVEGRTKVQVAAKGPNLPTPSPISFTQYFSQEPGVAVQLVNDATPTCWSAHYTTADRNDEDVFKATAR